MALIYNNITDGPQTHVLIIGVGHYPYLKNGSRMVQQRDEGLNSLGQLSSPPVSAFTFYRKMIDYQMTGRWAVSLGSVEVLISPNVDAAHGFGGDGLEAPTIKNIKSRFFEWKERCNRHEDNVAIFFFCGHGLQKEQHYLLAEDFGKDFNYPWEGAFDFDDTRLAFHQCRAKTQIFLVDACRMLTPNMLRSRLTVPPLEHPEIVDSECVHDLTMKAAASNEASYGPLNGPSFFTQAILASLDGAVASKLGDQWVVLTSDISANIYAILRQVEPSQAFRQRCQYVASEPNLLLSFACPPKAVLEVSCSPDDALPLAELRCTYTRDRSEQSRAPMPDPWILPLDAGIYKLTAHFANQEYNSAEIYTSVLPPVTFEKISCI